VFRSLIAQCVPIPAVQQAANVEGRESEPDGGEQAVTEMARSDSPIRVSSLSSEVFFPRHVVLQPGNHTLDAYYFRKHHMLNIYTTITSFSPLLERVLRECTDPLRRLCLNYCTFSRLILQVCSSCQCFCRLLP
jgi:hypothetical protein